MEASGEPRLGPYPKARGENMTFFFLSAILYFLPTILARHKADFMGIFLLNLLAGWTVIGWFIALIWACSAESYIPVRMVPAGGGRFCSQCGALSPSGAHYCSMCGRMV
jgi:hypothetical protein